MSFWYSDITYYKADCTGIAAVWGMFPSSEGIMRVILRNRISFCPPFAFYSHSEFKSWPFNISQFTFHSLCYGISWLWHNLFIYLFCQKPNMFFQLQLKPWIVPIHFLHFSITRCTRQGPPSLFVSALSGLSAPSCIKSWLLSCSMNILEILRPGSNVVDLTPVQLLAFLTCKRFISAEIFLIGYQLFWQFSIQPSVLYVEMKKE